MLVAWRRLATIIAPSPAIAHRYGSSHGQVLQRKWHCVGCRSGNPDRVAARTCIFDIRVPAWNAIDTLTDTSEYQQV